MYIIRRLVVWMRRIRHCRGFGVQSPWAYGFIRYVVNEHYPYYEYERLEREVIGINKKTRKLCRLFLRIANYCQAESILDFYPETYAYRTYFNAGCRHTKVIKVDGDLPDKEYRAVLDSTGSMDVLRLSLKGHYRRFYEMAVERVHDGSLFIIQGIKRNKEAAEFWNSIVEDKRCTVTFDLYYCGIIFFDKKRYKQNYIVNF